MHLAVDDARENVKAGAVDGLAADIAWNRANCGDATGGDTKIAPADAVMIGNDAAA